MWYLEDITKPNLVAISTLRSYIVKKNSATFYWLVKSILFSMHAFISYIDETQTDAILLFVHCTDINLCVQIHLLLANKIELMSWSNLHT